MSNSGAVTAKKIGIWTSLGIACFAGLVLTWWIWYDVPQLKFDHEVFGSIDALFTAVSSRSTSRLSDCEKRLLSHHSAGRITNPAWNRLSNCIEKAKQDQWEEAARELYHFIASQRGSVKENHL